MRFATIFCVCLFASIDFAHAHWGHVGEVAGHGHWIAVGGLVVAGILAGLLGKKHYDEAKSDDAEQESGDTEGEPA